MILRTVLHDQESEHARPTNLLQTGRPTSGTVVYPSIGSIIGHERGPRAEGVPPYVVMGYPNVTRGPGFLGAKYGYVYLTDTEAGPAGLRRPSDVTDEQQRRRLLLLDGLARALSGPRPPPTTRRPTTTRRSKSRSASAGPSSRACST